jgi:diguanylate cyclase (GGDEF)-like protein
MIAVAVFVAVTILAFNIWLFADYVDEKIDVELDRALLEVVNEINILEAKSAHIASQYFASDPEIVKALASGDREALLAHAMRLHDVTGIELGIITDASGKVLVRTHAPEVYGDDLTMMHVVRAALAGKMLSLTESGALTRMSARAGAPIVDEQGRLLGAAITGFRLDTEQFVDKHKDITGCEVSIIRGNKRVATTLLQEDGTRAVGMEVPEHIMQTLLEGKAFSDRIYMLNTETLVRYSPMLDSDGQMIGALFVGYFLTEKTNTVRSFIKTGLISTIIILGIGSLIIMVATNRIATPINKKLDKVYYDGLTGVYNRRYFDENIERIIQSMSRPGGMLSLMMIDVDCFKLYNDTYGHHAGDECLRSIAQALAQNLSRTDDFVARYGGEEFVVVLPHTDENGARVIADKLLESVRKCNIPHEKSATGSCVTISIGVTFGNVEYTQCGTDYVKQADKALYIAKQNGRNQYIFESLKA